RVLSVPHALNPYAFAWRRPRPDRTLDIASRSFPYPIYVGNDVRNRLYREADTLAGQFGLRSDVRLTDRLNRRDWAALLN
uniref:hypothetical protein n=1 Tax=Streptococcus pneumoniae TaxID=1313 RepID=UPI001952D014